MRFETRILLKEVIRFRPTTIDSGSTVAHAAEKMCHDEVGSCIVLTKSVPVGIITEQDINCKVVAKNRVPGDVYVHEVMSTPLITIGIDKTVEDAATIMMKHKVRRIPVVEDSRVVGIVTVRDILAASNEMNGIMSNLIEINRLDEIVDGICDGCGGMSDNLVSVNGNMLCPGCLGEDEPL
ncbi:MAG: CBS domain-containing protein [Methanomicrobiales archaeon]|jgi:signal-transduction protein with cAMP-binding, CBS, and nucleotidyltransferase domain|nr:CBS domain-containing protein [Methanomicrobiales archaeon]